MTINRNIPGFLAKWHRRSALGLLAGALFLNPAAGMAELSMPLPPKTKKKNAPPLPPQAVSASVTIRPGETVQIPLRVYGRQGASIRYLIREEPRHGRIVDITPTSREATWTLTYHHTSRMPEGGELQDQILFAAQDEAGTSAPAEIRILIAEPPADLDAPRTIDFGRIPAGLPVAQTFTLANRGGHIIEGTLAAEGGWSVEPGYYRLKKGESAAIRLTLTPKAAGEFRGALRLSNRPEEPIALRAEAFAALEVEPATLELLPNAETLARSGTLTLQNQTGEALAVKLQANPRLHLPETITLPPHGKEALPVSLEDPAALETTLLFQASGVERSVPLKAPQAGPRLRVKPGSGAFGKVETGRRGEIRVQLENWGGANAEVTAYAPPPFEASPEQFELPAGETREIAVTLTPAWSGPLSRTLKFQAGGLTLDLPLTAEVTSHAPATPAIAEPTPPPPGKTKPVVEHHPSHSGSRKLELVRLTGGEAEIAWEPVKDAVQYEVQARRLALDAGGSIQISWVPMPGVTLLEERSGRRLARIAGIPQGASVMLQVAPVTAEGKKLSPSAPLSFAIAPKTPFFTVKRLLLAAFTLVLAGALWLRSGRALFGLRLRS